MTRPKAERRVQRLPCPKRGRASTPAAVDQHSQPTSIVEGKTTPYIWKSQKIPIRGMHDSTVRVRQRRNLRVRDQAASGPASRFEKRYHLLRVIGGCL
jgi:hypothetical protein